MSKRKVPSGDETPNNDFCEFLTGKTLLIIDKCGLL